MPSKLTSAVCACYIVTGQKVQVSEKRVEMMKHTEMTSSHQIQVVQTQQTGESCLASQFALLPDDLIIVGRGARSPSPIVSHASTDAMPIRGVEGAPVFVEALHSVRALPGADACFECCVTGTPCRLIWLHNDSELTAEPRYEFSHGRLPGDDDRVRHVLTVSNVYGDDVGVYTARASNSRGVATSVATLTVQG